MTARLLVQMMGRPGSGKTTVARALAPRIGAVVLDKDFIKAAVLRSGVPAKQAGPAAYEVYFALAEEVLAQGYSVILDTPVYWPVVEQRWQELCQRAGVRRVIAECVLGDAERVRRLAARQGLELQTADVEDFGAPAGLLLAGERIVVDTTGSLEESVGRALSCLEAGVFS